MVSPQKIKYNGVFSDVGLGVLDIILDVAFDSDNGATSSYLNRSAVASDSYDGRYKNTHRYKYDELFSPQFTIVKKDFSDFTQEEVRQVLKYLTSTDKPALLEVYYDGASNIVDWACIGGWTSIETYKLANSRTVGILAQFEAVTPFAMSDLYTITQNVTNSINNKITINIDTDDNKPVYPRVTLDHGYNGAHRTVIRIADGTVLTAISDMVENTVYYNGTTWYWKTVEPTWQSNATKPDYEGWTTVEIDREYTEDDTYANNTFYYYAAGDIYYWIDPYYFHESSDNNPNLSTTSVRITNKHTDFLGNVTTLAATIVKNNNNSEKVVLDGANKIASSSSVNRIFDDNFNWVWLSLLDGKNELTIEGNCMVTIEYREPRKVGEY